MAIGTTSAMMELRAATWPSHQRLEKGLDIKTRFSERDAYRRHLRQMWGFCAELESSLGPQSFRGALPDYENRRKLPLLTQDLAALGVDPSPPAATSSAATAADTAAAFGRVYVLEGATLGGRVLLPMVEARLGLTAAHGAAFLASYGHEVPMMWQKFSAALNEWCCLPERQAAAIDAATSTFDALTNWLYREPV